MKLGKVIALMLVLLPFSMGAQEVDQSVEKRIDSLATEVTTLDKVVQKLSKFNVSAYIQGQYQYGQEDATLKVGDKNENLDKGFNRIGIRRGRMKFEYNDGIGTGAVQIEVNDKGVSFRDLYIGIKDPWTKRSQLMAGVFNRPFGYEVCYSTSSLESPERATIIQYFFPDERDLGAMLTLRTKTTSPLSFLRLDAGLFAGNSINRETDSRKDFIGRFMRRKNGSRKMKQNGMPWRRRSRNEKKSVNRKRTQPAAGQMKRKHMKTRRLRKILTEEPGKTGVPVPVLRGKIWTSWVKR